MVKTLTKTLIAAREAPGSIVKTLFRLCISLFGGALKPTLKSGVEAAAQSEFERVRIRDGGQQGPLLAIADEPIRSVEVCNRAGTSRLRASGFWPTPTVPC